MELKPSEPAGPALAAVLGLIGSDDGPSQDLPGDGAVAAKIVAVPAPPDPLTADGRRGPLSGTDWGGYRIGDLVGEGGMGEVYRAVQRSVGRVVALKVLPTGGAEDPERRQRFAGEARAAARLRSPQVVAVYDSGEHEGRLWLAMEFIDGPSLADELRRRRQAGGRFTPIECIDLVLQAARGLAVAHAERLVHRDIKPGNLLLDAGGQLKVADFGLVRFLDERSLTVTGTMLGTPLYLAPEQGRGQSTDARGDIYSLGVVLYELLTMRTPFSGRNAEEVISRHNFAEPELPSTLNPDVPHDLQAVCLKCLQKAPERRFASAAELIADLERQRAGLAPLVAVFEPGRPTTGAEEALRRLAGWRRRWWPLVTALVLTLCAIAAAWWWWDARKTAQADLRTRLAPLAQAAPVPATAEDDLAGLARLAGDDDPQVVQGRGKLARIARLAERLEMAAAQADPGPEARRGWQSDLAALGEELGPGDARLDRHRSALAAAESRVTALRTRLAGRLSGVGLPEAGLRAAVLPDLDLFARLAGGQDRDLGEWRGLIARSLQAMDADRAILGRLDRPEPLPASGMSALATACARLQRLADVGDPDLLRWTEHLAELERLAPLLAGWPGMRVAGPESIAAGQAALARWTTRHGDAAVAAAAAAALSALAGPPAPPWAAGRGHDRCGPWLDLRVGEAVQRLRWLPAGAWPVGSAAGEEGREDDETPAAITTAGLWVADSECSQALWLAVMGSRPARWRDAGTPVEQVSRRDAEDFCRRLAGLLPGCRVRLPAEAEWEAAVRAGDAGPWAGLDRAQAAAAVVHAGSDLTHAAPAGQGPANRLGIRDGAGNLWEWCRDDWGPAPGDGPAVARISGSGTGTVKGGSWADPLERCRPANRADMSVDARSPYVGFRMVVEP